MGWLREIGVSPLAGTPISRSHPMSTETAEAFSRLKTGFMTKKTDNQQFVRPESQSFHKGGSTPDGKPHHQGTPQTPNHPPASCAL